MYGRLRIVICLLGAALAVAAFAQGRDDAVGMPPEATIYALVVQNYWQTNCYIVAGKTGQALIIDPGDSMDMTHAMEDSYKVTGETAAEILRVLAERKLTLKYMVLSHGHLDHIGAIAELKEKTGAQILMHEGDVRTTAPYIGTPKDTRMFNGGLPKVDRTLKHDEILELDGMRFRVIHTPGHSPGGICLYTTYRNRPILFSGDTLLYHSLGRTNFRDGSGDQDLLYKMIRERLFTLPEETFVLTGHYEYTTIGEEKKNNPFLNPPPDAAAPAN